MPRPALVERISQLADSVEQARSVVLALIDERDNPAEERLELFLVETRDDMQRLAGRPVGGFAQPGELTAALVAGPGYHAFFRHELTHAYSAHRWGVRRSGAWLDEGLAALATGPCQGHSIDEIAAGYVRRGDAPTLSALAGDFYKIPELPGYFTAASLTEFVKRHDGVSALRAIWRGERGESTPARLVGADTGPLVAEWRRHLATLTPATLDTLRLRRDGC